MENNKTAIIVGVVVILLVVAIFGFGVGGDIGGWGSGGNM